MTKEAIVINFDAILNNKGELKLLEPGPGLNRVGYGIGWNDPTRKRVKENIVEGLLQFYSRVYVVEFEKNIEHTIPFNLRPNFLACHRDKVVVVDLAEIIAQKNQLDNDAVIVPALSGQGKIDSEHMEVILRKNDVNLPVANASLMFRIFQTKFAMNEIVRRFVPALLPDQTLLEYDDPNAVALALATIKSDHIILKPLDSTRADGVVLIPRAKLGEVVSWLDSKDPDKTSKINSLVGDDADLRDKLLQLNADTLSSYRKTCIAQEYIQPKHVVHPSTNKTFRPTIRFVVLAVYDSKTKTTHVSFIDSYYKLPEVPVQDDSLTWGSCISYSKLNRSVQWEGPQPSAAKIRAAQTQLPANANYDSSFIDIMDRSDKERIISQAQNLQPVFHYLLTENFCDRMTQIISTNSAYSRLVKGCIKMSSNIELSEKFCETMLKHGINLVVILITYLITQLESQDEIVGDLSIISPDYPDLLMLYADTLDRRNKVDLIYIQGSAQTIIDKYRNHLKKFLANSNNGDQVLSLIEQYSNNCFDTAKEIYQRGTSKYNEKKYSEAMEDFKIALLRFPENSVQAATCYSSMASCYIKLGQYDLAVNSAQQSLTLREKLLSQEKVTLDEVTKSSKKCADAVLLYEGECLFQYGLRELKAGNPKSSAALFTQAIEKHVRVQDQSLRLSMYYYNLATSYDRDNDVVTACVHAETCLKMRQNLGDDSERLKTALTKYNMLLDKKRKQEEGAQQTSNTVASRQTAAP